MIRNYLKIVWKINLTNKGVVSNKTGGSTMGIAHCHVFGLHNLAKLFRGIQIIHLMPHQEGITGSKALKLFG